MADDSDTVDSDSAHEHIIDERPAHAGAATPETPVSGSRARRSALGLALVVATVAGVAIVTSQGEAPRPAAAPLRLGAERGPAPDLVPVGVASRGDEHAAVTVVEFADFECDYCARYTEQTLPALLETYGDKIRYVFRHYPLAVVHPAALPAAFAAECANRQDKFWAYHDRLFAHPADLGIDELKSHAKAVGIDKKAFDRCLDKGEAVAAVQRDIAAAQRLGLRGTPSFVINGDTIILGAKTLADFQKVIDPLLR